MPGEARSTKPQAVLFACGFNSVRSPMAAGLFKRTMGPAFYVSSAGVRKDDLDPFAVAALDEVGIAGEDRIVGISQGWKLTGAIKTAERKLTDGSLRHGGQAVMSWAVANARVEPKGNAIIITKQASGSAKIDPLMAAFNAVALMSTNPWSSRPRIFVI